MAVKHLGDNGLYKVYFWDILSDFIVIAIRLGRRSNPEPLCIARDCRGRYAPSQ